VDVQRALAKHGYSPGAVDGDFGPRTEAAVKNFQRAKGLETDGIVGPNTWKALAAAPSTSKPPSGGSGPVLREGAHGEPVRQLQNRLAHFGFNPGAADGDFGPKTESAVKAFQRSRGLEADGIVGPNTWKSLGITAHGNVTYPSSGTSGPGGMVTRQGYRMTAETAKAFDRMNAASGGKLQINSAYRTYEEQAALYRKYGSPRAAKPGHSAHHSGRALDLGPPSMYNWLARNCEKYGFVKTVSFEPWHFEYKGR